MAVRTFEMKEIDGISRQKNHRLPAKSKFPQPHSENLPAEKAHNLKPYFFDSESLRADTA